MINWRLYTHGKPVAISVLACYFDNEFGDWVFNAIDPGDFDRHYTHWVPLDELKPQPRRVWRIKYVSRYNSSFEIIHPDGWTWSFAPSIADAMRMVEARSLTVGMT